MSLDTWLSHLGDGILRKWAGVIMLAVFAFIAAAITYVAQRLPDSKLKRILLYDFKRKPEQRLMPRWPQSIGFRLGRSFSRIFRHR